MGAPRGWGAGVPRSLHGMFRAVDLLYRGLHTRTAVS